MNYKSNLLKMTDEMCSKLSISYSQREVVSTYINMSFAMGFDYYPKYLNLKKNKPVTMLNKYGEKLCDFESATVASYKTGIPRTSIRRVLKGKQNNVRGKIFRFTNKVELI